MKLPLALGLLTTLLIGAALVARPGAPAGAAAPPATTPGPGNPDPRATPVPTETPGDRPGLPGRGQTVRRTTPGGVAAIPPRKANPSPAEAAFAIEDVAAYVATHRVGGLGRLTSDGPGTIETVEFLPHSVAAARLQADFGRPDDALLCVVTLRGNFSVALPGGVGIVTFHRAVQVFDAHTGNLLMQGQAP